MDTAETIINPNWRDHTSFVNDHAGLTTIEYDNCFDMVWMGHLNGRVSSYSLGVESYTETAEVFYPSIERYSSFMVSNDIVSQILPNQTNVVAVSQSKLSVRSYGGFSLGNVHMPMAVADDHVHGFTCGELVRSPSISRNSGNFISSSVVAGTTGNWAFLYDLNTIQDSPVMTYDVSSPSVKILSNGHLTCVAGYDGHIRLLDGKFRSREVLNTLEAHMGVVKDMCLQLDGRTLITCGLLGMNSSYQYGADPVIKAFDLRMQRQLPPLPVELPPSNTGVRFLRFVQNPSAEYSDTVASAVAMVTEEGVVQITNLVSESAVPQVLYAPISDTASEFLTSCAVSSSGQFLSVGTSHGTFGQFMHFPDEARTAIGEKIAVRVNENSPHLKTAPKSPPAPLMSLPPDALVLATAYTLRPPKKHEEQHLSSSFQSTPHVMKKRMQLCSAKIISVELRAKITRHDFIGIIPHAGIAPNSMIYTLPGKSVGYANSDPRKQHSEAHHRADKWGASPHSRSPMGGGFDGQHSPVPGGMLPPAAGMSIPVQYRFQRSAQVGKQQRYLKFNYLTNNKTEFVGLENNVPNSFLNALLQTLYHCKEVREQALRSQLSPFHHQENNQSSLWCELGFLFHMMQHTETVAAQLKSQGSGSEIEMMVRPANFQRIFQTYELLPEVAALALFDETAQKDVQQITQAFAQFLLRHLSKDLEAEMKASTQSGGKHSHKNTALLASAVNSAASGNVRNVNVLDELFGFSVRSSTTFLHSGTVKVEAQPSRLLFLELAYPSVAARQTLKPGSAVPSAAKKSSTSCAAVFWTSLQKETFMKGWCQESEAYEPFKKMQSVESLPAVFCVTCGDTQRDIKETTLAGALGETQSQGNVHTNFWASKALTTAKWGDGIGCEEGGGVVQVAWLPVEMEIAYAVSLQPLPSQTVKKSPSAKQAPAAASRLIISCRCVELPASGALCSTSAASTLDSTSPAAPSSRWIVFDGTNEKHTLLPASQLPDHSFDTSTDSDTAWTVERFDLTGLISQIADPSQMAGDNDSSCRKHSVAHIRKSVKPSTSEGSKTDDSGGGPSGASTTAQEWFLFNDFVVSPSNELEVVSFPDWRHPCLALFSKVSVPGKSSAMLEIARGAMEAKEPAVAGTEYMVPESVLFLESLSHIPCIRMQSFASIPGPGDLIAFDGEFVSVALEKSDINHDGQRVVSEEGRQVLARISLLDAGQVMLSKPSTSSDGLVNSAAEDATLQTNSSLLTKQSYASGSSFNKNMMRILADDYILPVEPVVDYVTRFSGITADDLNPHTSKHAVVTHRTAYLKLRYFIDRKCIFVGHGLEKDFETANLFIPPEQVRDTVDLWRLPRQRKISLRFLASYLLKEDIQDEIHDSIEDAKTALLLYRHYEATAALGADHLAATLRDLYEFGNKNNWTIGLDRLKR